MLNRWLLWTTPSNAHFKPLPESCALLILIYFHRPRNPVGVGLLTTLLGFLPLCISIVKYSLFFFHFKEHFEISALKAYYALFAEIIDKYSIKSFLLDVF